VTMFTAPPPEGTRPPTWDRLTGALDPHARGLERLAEDDRALGLLGVTYDRLGLLDGQYRAQPHDHSHAVRLLAPLLAGADHVWAPSGIGQHVDHLAARDAALAAAPAGTAVSLYADLPYALVYGWPRWVDPAAGTPMLDAGPWFEAELEAAGLVLDRLIAIPRELTESAAARKLDAMAAYRSQLPSLDAQSGGRLSDPAVMRFELAWAVDRASSPLREGWAEGANGGWLPGNRPTR
jgi:LmbE family N-acetylglucosaminyl deacetylase